MMRSFAEHMGVNWPPDWVMLVDGVPVTRQQVREGRRQKQADRMERIRNTHTHRRVIRITVRYFDQFFYGGWQAYVDWTGGESHWARRGSYLADQLMRAFPLTLDAAFPVNERDYHTWLQAFAQAYPSGKHDKKPRGMLKCWATIHGDRIEEFGEIVP